MTQKHTQPVGNIDEQDWQDVFHNIMLLRKQAEPYLKNGLVDDWQDFIATSDALYFSIKDLIAQSNLALLDRLEAGGMEISVLCANIQSERALIEKRMM